MLLLINYDVILILASYFYTVKYETTSKKKEFRVKRVKVKKQFKPYVLDRNSNYRNRISDIKKASSKSN